MINYLSTNNLILFLVVAIGIWLALWVYFANRKNKVNRNFFLMVISILLWITFYHFASLSTKQNLSLSLFRISGGFVFIFFIFYYSFIIKFLNKKGGYELFGKFISTYGFTFFLFTIFTNFIIPTLRIEEWGASPWFSLFGWFAFYGYVMILTILINILLIVDYSQSPKEKKQKIQYFLLGLFLFAGLNFIFNVILQVLFQNYKYYQFGNYSAIFLLVFTAYAIVKKNLFNIKTVLATFLVGLPATVLAVDTIVFTSTITLRILKTIVFFIFLWLGYSLVQNVKKEVERRKVLEKLTKELKIANKDLKETLEAKNNFLTVASHQLRTPTSVIKGMLDMLMDNSMPSEKKEDFIQRCSVQACHLSNTIRDILSSTAIEGKGFELIKSLTNIDELTAKIVEEKKIQLEENNRKRERNVELIYNQPKTPTPQINIDSNKIGEVIANLIDNAIQYTLKGKIEIATKTDSENFIFNIKDTGVGIEKQDMPKLFKKIARLPNAISICPDGTGLGLFIIKSMVEKHGGKVEVKSGGENKGSEFTFWLPSK